MRAEVHLLEPVLAHVADRDGPGVGVEREPPRVPKPVGPGLGPRARLVGEGVAGGDGVRLSARRLRVDAKDLAEQRGEVLTDPVGVREGYLNEFNAFHKEVQSGCRLQTQLIPWNLTSRQGCLRGIQSRERSTRGSKLRLNGNRCRWKRQTGAADTDDSTRDPKCIDDR